MGRNLQFLSVHLDQELTASWKDN